MVYHGTDWVDQNWFGSNDDDSRTLGLQVRTIAFFTLKHIIFLRVEMLTRLVKESLIRRVYGRVVLRVVDDVGEHSRWVKPVIFRERFHNRGATCLP